MYGRFSNSGIVAIKDHAEALKRWDGIKPIRGRAGDERPIGKRSKNYMQIRKNDDGSVACVLYKSDVVTFFPDNKVRVSVPPQWRSNTTAKFIEDVLGYYRVGTCIKDNDLIMAVKGSDARYLRAGENVMFELDQGGSLKLISNDRVHTIYNIDRTAMNAARKSLKSFMKYLLGSIKLREGVYSLEQANDVVNYLRSTMELGKASAAREWYTRAAWDLELPRDNYYHRSVGIEELIKMYKFFIDRAINGSPEEHNHLACWAAMSAGSYNSRDEKYITTTAQAKKLVDGMLLAINPSIFVKQVESRERIQINRYRNFERFVKLAEEQA